MSLNDLKGKTIDEILVSEDKDLICFKSHKSKEAFVFSAAGDCCSHSWIDEVAMGNGFLPATVIEVQQESGDIISHPCHDSLKTYYVRLKKEDDYHECLITFKNSSNGYYGGSLEKYEDTYDESKMNSVKPG